MDESNLRATSNMRLGEMPSFPREVTIPDLIDSEKEPYYTALRHADAAFASGTLDISLMEELMSSMFAKQLLEIHKRASLSNHQGNDRFTN